MRTGRGGVRDLVDRATAVLADAGVPGPEHDAWALLEHASGLRRLDLLALDAGAGTVPGRAAFEGELLPARAARVPLQHLTGRAPFRYLDLAVGPGVFVPRPETEDVAGYAVAEATEVSRRGRTPLVVDLCTGSGAIALAVATEVPTAVVHAVDVDPAALAWAARNVAATATADRVVLHEADVVAVAEPGGALAGLRGSVDVVVANPPYVPAGRAASLDPEVRDHDPDRALYGGDDGLAVVRSVLAVAGAVLRRGGLLVVEHDDTQGPRLAELLGRGWDEVRGHADLAGRPRATTARRTTTGEDA